MPYIDRPRRADINAIVAPALEAALHLNEGEMNYLLTSLVMQHVTHGQTMPPRYADFEQAIGLVECVKLELYRRAVAPYEDAQANKNGDIAAYIPRKITG